MDENGFAQTEMPRRAAIAGMLAAAAGSTVVWCRPWQGTGRTRYVTPESFGAAGDGVTDDAVAFRDACRHCTETGSQLRLARRRYRGARVEVHGSFDVLGEGATVDYLGIGNTLIEGRGRAGAAIATAWPAVDRDAYADRFPVRMFMLTRPADRGATTLVLRHNGSLQPGDRIFLAQRPTSMSSGGRPGNYIPGDFGFARVRTVKEGHVTLVAPLADAFEAGAGVFVSSGIAVGCTISDLTIATDADAYQHVLRSGIDIALERITFAGESAVGACTFADRISYRDCRVEGAYGPLSVARGCGSVLIDGFTFATRRGKPTAEPFALFLEESFRHVELRRVEGHGAGFSIRSTDMGRVQRPGQVLLDRCSFQTVDAVQGATGPFQGGVAIGVNLAAKSCVFRGAAIAPDPGLFPGINQRALTWMASIGKQDRLSFVDCQFESINGGVAVGTGGGFQGLLDLDPRVNHFIGCHR